MGAPATATNAPRQESPLYHAGKTRPHTAGALHRPLTTEAKAMTTARTWNGELPPWAVERRIRRPCLKAQQATTQNDGNCTHSRHHLLRHATSQRRSETQLPEGLSTHTTTVHVRLPIATRVTPFNAMVTTGTTPRLTGPSLRGPGLSHVSGTSYGLFA